MAVQIETGSWMERVTGNHAALSLFHLLLEESLPIAVDTSAGIFSLSAASLYRSPLSLYFPYISEFREFRGFTISAIRS